MSLDSWDQFKLTHAVRGPAGELAKARLEGDMITLIITPSFSGDFELNFTTSCCRSRLVAAFGSYSLCDKCERKLPGTIGPAEWAKHDGSLRAALTAHLEAWDTNPLMSEVVAGIVENHIHWAVKALKLYAQGKSKTLESAYQKLATLRATEL